MADMIMPEKKGRRKAHSLRIDFTPMVDLGFLLITFFIYTTTMANPKVLQVRMPDPSAVEDPTVYPYESSITLIPVSRHKVLYYYGSLPKADQIKQCDIAYVRGVLLEKKGKAARLPATYPPSAHQLHVLIKPADNCRYEDVVKLLDEMSILNVQYYAITDLSDEERLMLMK